MLCLFWCRGEALTPDIFLIESVSLWPDFLYTVIYNYVQVIIQVTFKKCFCDHNIQAKGGIQM